MTRLLRNTVAYVLVVLMSISLTSCAGWYILGGAAAVGIYVGSSGDDDDHDSGCIGQEKIGLFNRFSFEWFTSIRLLRLITLRCSRARDSFCLLSRSNFSGFP